MSSASLFEPIDLGFAYHIGFGAAHLDHEGRYKCMMVERAIGSDNVPMLDEAIERKWIDADTRCFNNGTVLDRCNERKAKGCAARLRELGWPQRYS